ncbi:MAG: peptide ABC transporter permease [Acidobacteria bacterium RIFCSPLOWO2_02_FULL_59_13]|nr:MAG: peptide ABC transporter permease [Acidobacteria bacterium RIFCSPLOWO2_02_FULL_59_13]
MRSGAIHSTLALFPPIAFGTNEDHLEDKYQAPSSRYWIGTDANGRDLLTRMIWGSRMSLSVGFVAVSIYVAIGLLVGTIAGYFRGWVDMVLSRVIEIVICFPTFFLILAVLAFLQPSIWNIMIVIGLTGWVTEARLIRGEFFRLNDQEFVLAAKALGVSDARIIFRHILPNGLAPVLVAASFGVASAILIESGLSFLGFGISIPVPSWGGILNEARENFRYWWITIFPGLAIFSTVTAYNLVGEGIRDAIDPRLKV